jgi:hypothetical protein
MLLYKTEAMCYNHSISTRGNGDPRKDQTRGDSPKFDLFMDRHFLLWIFRLLHIAEVLSEFPVVLWGFLHTKRKILIENISFHS